MPSHFEQCHDVTGLATLGSTWSEEEALTLAYPCSDRAEESTQLTVSPNLEASAQCRAPSAH